MKTTGMVRPIDSLGRIVIPKELRKVFKIDEKDSLEIFVDRDMIILKKYEPACLFCGDTEKLISYEGRMVCAGCIEKMKEAQDGK